MLSGLFSRPQYAAQSFIHLPFLLDFVVSLGRSSKKHSFCIKTPDFEFTLRYFQEKAHNEENIEENVGKQTFLIEASRVVNVYNATRVCDLCEF